MAALAWRNQDRQPHRRSSDGRVGWRCGWKSKRAYHPSLEKIRTERGEINLGRGGGCRLARRASESESARDCPAHARGIARIAKCSGRRTPANDGFRRGALHRIAVDAFRTLLPRECTPACGSLHLTPCRFVPILRNRRMENWGRAFPNRMTT